MPWPRFRNPIQKLIVPTADLGLGELDFSGLQFPDDVPLVLALQVIQTPAGPRIVQGAPSGNPVNATSGKRIIRALTTEGAGNTGPIDVTGWQGFIVYVEILALNGAPTNIQYRPAVSVDNGATWYEGVNVQATTAGLVIVQFGPASNASGAGNDVKAIGGMAVNFPDQVRLDWVLTAGTAPTVQHRMTGYFR